MDQTTKCRTCGSRDASCDCGQCVRCCNAQEIEAEARARIVQGLRELASFLEAHPEVPTPYVGTQNAFVQTKEEIAAVARVGSWEKKWIDDWFSLDHAFSGDVKLSVNVARAQVCERVVTGKQIIPAQPEREIDVYEWHCDESLLAPEKVSP